jgi:hypothetical protein
LKNANIWTSQQQVNMMVEQAAGALMNKYKKKEVQFAILF